MAFLLHQTYFGNWLCLDKKNQKKKATSIDIVPISFSAFSNPTNLPNSSISSLKDPISFKPTRIHLLLLSSPISHSLLWLKGLLGDEHGGAVRHRASGAQISMWVSFQSSFLFFGFLIPLIAPAPDCSFLFLGLLLVELKKLISCALRLSNKTNHYVAFKVAIV